MRISDWSSDVCSSDLRRRHILDAHARPETVLVAERVEARLLGDSRPGQNDDAPAFHICPTVPVPERMTRKPMPATRLREDWGDDRRKRAGTGINKNVGRGRMPFKILTVCTGNVCRSPSAEVVLRDHLAAPGLGGLVTIDFAAPAAHPIGEPPPEPPLRPGSLRGDRSEKTRV